MSPFQSSSPLYSYATSNLHPMYRQPASPYHTEEPLLTTASKILPNFICVIHFLSVSEKGLLSYYLNLISLPVSCFHFLRNVYWVSFMFAILGIKLCRYPVSCRQVLRKETVSQVIFWSGILNVNISVISCGISSNICLLNFKKLFIYFN